MYRVIIVDDEPWSVIGIQKTFAWKENGFEVVGIANDAYEALDKIAKLHPDLVLTDIRMPEMSGLELIENVKARGFACQFVILSGFGEFAYAQQALRYNVLDYVIKPISFKEADQMLKKVRCFLDQQTAEEDFQIFEQLGIQPGLFEKVCRCRGVSLAPENLTVTAAWGTGLSPDDIGGVEEDAVLFLKSSIRNGMPVYLIFHNKPLQLGKGIIGGSSRVCRAESNLHTAVKEALLALHTALFLEYPTYSFAVNGQMRCLARFELVLNHFTKRIREGGDARMAFLQELPEVFVKENFDLRDAVQLLNHAFLLAGEKNSGVFWDTDSLLSEFTYFRNACGFLSNLFEKGKCAVSEGVNEGFRHLLDYVNQHYTDPLSLSTLAAEYYLNFSYTSSLFKKTTGQTFSDYLTELRMKRAKELLADPSASISEVSTQCGYEDSYYFSKVFKKRYGVTPSAYRAAQ